MPSPMTLVSIPANPVPEGAVAGTFKTPDGVELRFARFAPPPGRKGTLCLFHGRAEFIEKHFEVVEDARARGFPVAFFAWRAGPLPPHVFRHTRGGPATPFPERAPPHDALINDT